MRRRKRRFAWATAGVAVVVAALVAGLVAFTGGPGLKLAPLSSVGHLLPAPSPGKNGPEGVPIPAAPALASTATATRGQVVDGIGCATSEQTLFHVHTHLTIFVDGKARAIPYGIGIVPPRQVQQTQQGPFVTGGSCFYWLHTHASDGIIHIESPVHRSFTLGDFFDIWGQPLGPDRVGPAHGKVTAFYNGQVYLGNPRDIPIGKHIQIQLDVGRPLVSPEHIKFPAGL